MTPFFSVLMSVRNGEQLVSASIASIVAQTYHRFELLVMDDGSSDGTWQLLQEWAARDRRIRVFTQPNAGLTVSLNRLMSLATGNIIARLDADDVASADRLEHQAAYLTSHSDVGVVSSWAEMVTADGRSIAVLCYPDDDRWLRACLHQGTNPITHSAVAMRREVLEGLDQVFRFRFSQDLDLWLRLLPATQFGIVQRALVRTRHHGGRMSAPSSHRAAVHDLIVEQFRRREAGLPEDDWRALQRRILSSLDARPSAGAFEHYIRGLELLNSGRPARAAAHFVNASPDRSLRAKSLARLAMCALPTPVRARLSQAVQSPLQQFHRPAAQAMTPNDLNAWASLWTRVHAGGHQGEVAL